MCNFLFIATTTVTITEAEARATKVNSRFNFNFLPFILRKRLDASYVQLAIVKIFVLLYVE